MAGRHALAYSASTAPGGPPLSLVSNDPNDDFDADAYFASGEDRALKLAARAVRSDDDWEAYRRWMGSASARANARLRELPAAPKRRALCNAGIPPERESGRSAALRLLTDGVAISVTDEIHSWVRAVSKSDALCSAEDGSGRTDRPKLRLVGRNESRPAGRPAATTRSKDGGGDDPGGSDPHLLLPPAPCWVREAVRYITDTETADTLTFARLDQILSGWPASWRLAVWNALPDAWFHAPSSACLARLDACRELGGAA